MSEGDSFCVSSGETGERLDVFLSQQLPEVSRSTIQRWIEFGHVTVGGEPSRAKYRLKEADEILVVAVPPEVPPELIPEPIPLKILYEDETLVVVNKRAGMVVHPGAGNWQGTLANALLYHFRQISHVDTVRPGIVHRLDKLTSGILAVAKNEGAHDFLAQQFMRREVEKRYLVLVYGQPRELEGTIDIALGRHPRSRTRISTGGRRARSAVTRYKVIQRYSDFSYVQAMPLTGRTHQIRVHFQHLGNPVVGDETYGRKALQHLDCGLQQSIQDLRRHFLHASFLSFVHPETKRKVSFEAPLPRELEGFLQALG